MILVVDDNPLDSKVHAGMVQSLGYACTVTTDGEEAIRRMPELAPQLTAILLDLDMPLIDGVSALGHFKVHYPQVPVIIVTGMDDVDHAAVCAQWGAVAFLQKPLNLTTLKSTLQAIPPAGMSASQAR